jgi:hypothetical protein
MKSKMMYIHARMAGSTALCGHTGVHTSKRADRVTCERCKRAMATRDAARQQEVGK